MKFSKLTRPNLRKLAPGQKVAEHGIEFERLPNGDGRFAVNIMVEGQRIHRVVGKESEGTTRLDAENFIAKTRTDASRGRLNLPKGRKLTLGFSRAAEMYLAKLRETDGKDMKMKEQRLTNHLKPFFKHKPLSQISTFEVERFKKLRQSQEATNGTINRELAVLSHLINKAMEWGWLAQKPCYIKRLKEESGRITYLTAEQVERLLQEAAKDDFKPIYPFILIGLETAMRRMEILTIRIENINTKRRVIFIPQAKAGAREQPITRRLAVYLEEYLKDKPESGWLFPSKQSKTGHVSYIEKPFRRVVEAAELDSSQVVRHTLRHTAITHLVQAGVDLPTVKRISGHKTLQMVERYSHQNGAHIEAAMDKLERTLTWKGADLA